ncbi:Y+L amino acid transporter 2-like [Procambarus clarkii]|uniref:Y+L amino acid transporter 2-like n=1 Tax=Procambarus clarkii TaxID=6728 RepID=UPI001E670298|nr:Y+L amino acid transporter 2-like [Procambarus clarkii]
MLLVSTSDRAAQTASPAHSPSGTQPQEAALMGDSSSSSSVNHRTPDRSESEKIEATVQTEAATCGKVEGKTSFGPCLNTGVQLKRVLGNVEHKTDSVYFQDSDVHLKRVLGLWNGVGMIVGIMIGSGIFVSPTTVVEYTGSVGMALAVWLATGLLSMVGGLCYAELGTTIPRNGGSYVYVLEAFGPIPAFLVLWINILVAKPASQAIVSLTFANYLLQAFLPDSIPPPYVSVKLLTAAMICLVLYVNCVGVKLGTYVQDALTMTKVVALIIIIVAGALHLARGHVKHFLDPMKSTIWDVSSLATAFYSTLFAYNGWDSLTYVTEELKDPSRNLPRAIAISMSIVSVIYTLTNVAYYAVLTPAEILSSSAVAVTFGSRMLGPLAWIIAFFVACSTAGNANGNLVARSRLTFAGAREGHLPQFLTLIHISHSTPVPALILSSIVPLAAIMADNVGALLAYTSFTNNLTNLTAVLGLLWLRYKEPGRSRPIKVWLGFPIFYLVVSVLLTVFPVIRRPVEIAVAFGIIIAGLIVYFLAIHLQSTPKCFANIMEKVTRLCQLVFLCCPEAQCQRN